MSETIILHISDLHFSSKEEIRREKENIMNSLVEALQQLEQEWKPNVVCVSGDIVDKYDILAYPLARAWFEKLAQLLDVSMDNFIFTPGNHDCSRDIKKYPKLDTDDECLVNEVLDYEIPAYLSGRFEAYENFCKELQVTPYTWRNGDNYLVGYRVINDVIYFGCNTEWFAYSDETKLRLGRKIVEELQQTSNELGNLKKVAIMHHGSEVGFHENEVQYHNGVCPALHFLWKMCDMTLYGHSHEQAGGAPNKMEDHCYTIKAGATSINSEYPNNVNIIRINENSLELKYINYSQENAIQCWQISDEFSVYKWDKEKERKQILTTSIGDFDQLRIKQRIYAREILDSKLRQVKTVGGLPETILRDVIIENNQKKDEKEKREENGKKNEKVHLIDVILAESRVVLYGELGAGKSTIFSQLVIELLDNNTKYFPILISAKELAENYDGKISSILQRICMFFQQQLLVSVDSLNDILQYVEHCNLFVDGLDEVDKKKQEVLMQALEQLPLMINQISVILSTRSTETIEYHRDNWVQCSLGRLQQQEILKILENEAKTEACSEAAILCAKQYLDKIDNNPMVQLVATTPLAVRLLYHIMRKNVEIDEYTIGDLLNTLLEERIARWDEKNISEVVSEEFEKSFPTVDAKKNYVGYLTYHAENDKITRRKLELMLQRDMNIQNQIGLVVEQTISNLHRNGMATEVDGKLIFSYRPLAQLATGVFMANQIVEGKIEASQCSYDLWREVSFAAGELRRVDLFGKHRPWFESYINGLKGEVAGLVKACYICYESGDIKLARNMIDNFKERERRPLWYYEPERNVSVSIVAQVIALSGEYGVDWFIDSYLTLTYPVINAGSAFFAELYMVLAPLIKEMLTTTHIEKLEKCIEPLEYICPIAYIRLPEVLCYLMPDKYRIERRLQLIARISSYDLYKGWALKEYSEMCVENAELCKKVLKNEKTFAAAFLWIRIFDDAPDISLLAKIIEKRDDELIEISRKRLGDETYIRYLRWLVANSSHTIAAASAMQLCSLGQDASMEIRLALIGGMINARKHNCYEEKITELIIADGGLSQQWVKILFAAEHRVYGASEGCWRIFLRFLVESNENLAQDFVKNIKYMGPFLLARCEETRLLLQRLLIRPEYKTLLIEAMSSLNPEIRHSANRIGLIACHDLEERCLYAVISECSGSETDNIEWQNYIAERKYQEKSIRKLSEKIPVMFPAMKALAERIIMFNTKQEIEIITQMTKEEMIAKEIETVASHGILYLRRYIHFLNNEMNYSHYLQLREKNKNKSCAEVLYCFSYEHQQYVVDWYRFLWFVFIGHKTIFHDADIIALELIEYGKENPSAVNDILEAVKKLCIDERFEKERWISNYHWLLLILYTFDSVDDSTIGSAFIRQEEYMWESSLALLAAYSGNKEELNIKVKKSKEIEIYDNVDCETRLLNLAKESEIISKQLDNIMEHFVQERCDLDFEYIVKLVELGENGALIAGTLCFCYGEPIPVESGLVARQVYFLWSKVESEAFIKLLRLTRAAFNEQLNNESKLEEYKAYLTEKEAHIDEVNLDKSFYISEYLYYMSNNITEEKILKYIDIVMNEMHYSKYTSLVWEILAVQINSNEKIDGMKIVDALEIAIHRIIGSCQEHRSYLYNEAYGQVALACMFWKINNKYVDLAQPVFERGIVQLIRTKYEKNIWDKEKVHIDFEKLNLYLDMVPKRIMRQVIECMKCSWLDEAVLLGNLANIISEKL